MTGMAASFCAEKCKSALDTTNNHAASTIAQFTYWECAPVYQEVCTNNIYHGVCTSLPGSVHQFTMECALVYQGVCTTVIGQECAPIIFTVIDQRSVHQFTGNVYQFTVIIIGQECAPPIYCNWPWSLLDESVLIVQVCTSKKVTVRMCSSDQLWCPYN